MASTELLAAEMEAFYRHYIDIFNGDDLTGFAALLSYPWGVVSGKRGMSVINDEAGFVRVFQKMKAGLKERGWARSAIDMMRAWPTGDDTGLLMADYSRHRKDGSVLERGPHLLHAAPRGRRMEDRVDAGGVGAAPRSRRPSALTWVRRYRVRKCSSARLRSFGVPQVASQASTFS